MYVSVCVCRCIYAYVLTLICLYIYICISTCALYRFRLCCPILSDATCNPRSGLSKMASPIAEKPSILCLMSTRKWITQEHWWKQVFVLSHVSQYTGLCKSQLERRVRVRQLSICHLPTKTEQHPSQPKQKAGFWTPVEGIIPLKAYACHFCPVFPFSKELVIFISVLCGPAFMPWC